VQRKGNPGASWIQWDKKTRCGGATDLYVVFARSRDLKLDEVDVVLVELAVKDLLLRHAELG